MVASKRVIYLDNIATTPIDPVVLNAMMPYLTDDFGSAASQSHEFGRRASSAVEASRASIVAAINASEPNHIIFTSGATESINLAIRGYAPFGGKRHIITTKIEHKAVLNSCRNLERLGYQVTYLPVDASGLLDVNRLSDAINETTFLVSIMMANNEIGTIQNLKSIGLLCRFRDVIFHTDATQGVGKIAFDVQDLNVDMASFTAHKIHGPKGVGALYVDLARIGGQLLAQIEGGGQEGGHRSGTLNVPAIVGFAKAIEIATASLSNESSRLENLRNRLQNRIISNLSDVYLNGHQTQCLPGLRSFSFKGIDANSLLQELSEIALSAGAACASAGGSSPSHVLKAIGLPDDMVRASVRFGLGRFNNLDDIDYTAARVIDVVKRLRARSFTSRQVA